MLITRLRGVPVLPSCQEFTPRLCAEPHKPLSQAPGAGRALLLLTPSSRAQAPPTFLPRAVLLLRSALFTWLQNRKDLGAELKNV